MKPTTNSKQINQNQAEQSFNSPGTNLDQVIFDLPLTTGITEADIDELFSNFIQ